MLDGHSAMEKIRQGRGRWLVVYGAGHAVFKNSGEEVSLRR